MDIQGVEMSNSMFFTYKDARGAVSRRILSSIRSDDAYLHGFCEYSNGLRTFRKDRIIRFFETNTDTDFLSTPIQPKKEIKRPAHSFEICFTGFAKTQRKELEDKATTYNLLVRSRVTTKLDFLCSGKTAGWKKLLQAEQQGVVLITEDEFNDLIIHGLMPQSWINISA